MTPVDAIITQFETNARDSRAKSFEEGLAHEDKIYEQGKADGYQEAADFLRGLQKLFN